MRDLSLFYEMERALRGTGSLYMLEARVKQGTRCLLFDLGDTLWYRKDQSSWDRLENESNQQACDLLHSYFNAASLPQIDDQALGQHLRQAFDEQVGASIRRSPLLEPDTTQAIINVLEGWDLKEINRSLGATLFEALRIRIPDSRPLFPDALATLAELRRRGFLLGVVTNRLWGGQPFREDLRTMGLLEHFDLRYIAISGELGIRKPDPRIFEYVLDALQVSPYETAMVGDSLSADILGAQSLGIYTVWKPKSWLYTWVLKQRAARSGQGERQLSAPSSRALPGADTANTQITQQIGTSSSQMKGMHATDDDYIMAHADHSRDYLERFSRGEIRPDHIIGPLTTLLEIFSQAGKL